MESNSISDKQESAANKNKMNPAKGARDYRVLQQTILLSSYNNLQTQRFSQQPYTTESEDQSCGDTV